MSSKNVIYKYFFTETGKWIWIKTTDINLLKTDVRLVETEITLILELLLPELDLELTELALIDL